MNNAPAWPAIDRRQPKDNSWDDYALGGGRLPASPLPAPRLPRFARLRLPPLSLPLSALSSRSRAGPFLRPHFPLPLSILRIRGYDPRSSRPAQLPCPLRSNHKLSLGSWPGLRERRQEARAAADGDVGLPWGSGSGAQWWKGSRQLRATPSARRPQGIPGPLLLLGPWNLGSQARSVAKGGGGSRGNTAFLLWASRKDLAFKGPQCPNPSPLRSGEAEPAAHSTPPTQARPALRGCNGTLSLEPTALGSLVKGVPHRTYLGEPPHSLILLQA